MSSDQPSRIWIERASEGDALAVDALLELHLPELRDYVQRRMGDVLDRESSSDLVQSTCREVLQHLERFQFDGEEGFRRWLWATALRKIKDRHRYHHAERRSPGREEGAADTPGLEPWLDRLRRTMTSPSSGAVRDEEVQRMRQVLGKLPEDQRRVVELAYVENLPHREIAVRLDITEVNARARLSRALAKLSGLLREQ